MKLLFQFFMNQMNLLGFLTPRSSLPLPLKRIRRNANNRHVSQTALWCCVHAPSSKNKRKKEGTKSIKHAPAAPKLSPLIIKRMPSPQINGGRVEKKGPDQEVEVPGSSAHAHHRLLHRFIHKKPLNFCRFYFTFQLKLCFNRDST